MDESVLSTYTYVWRMIKYACMNTMGSARPQLMKRQTASSVRLPLEPEVHDGEHKAQCTTRAQTSEATRAHNDARSHDELQLRDAFLYSLLLSEGCAAHVAESASAPRVVCESCCSCRGCPNLTWRHART